MIGTMNEKSLHAALKELYQQPGDIIEGKLDNYFIDIIRGEQLIEIQTANFSAIKGKLTALVENHPLRLVHPIAAERHIVYVDPDTGERQSRRKSPKKGTVLDVFRELIRIPQLLSEANFSLEVVLISEEEIRCRDGQGSWRRRGISIVDRRLMEVAERVVFQDEQDFADVIPQEMANLFSNKELSSALGIPANQARKITYTLRKAGILEAADKRGNEILYKRIV